MDRGSGDAAREVGKSGIFYNVSGSDDESSATSVLPWQDWRRCEPTTLTEAVRHVLPCMSDFAPSIIGH